MYAAEKAIIAHGKQTLVGTEKMGKEMADDKWRLKLIKVPQCRRHPPTKILLLTRLIRCHPMVQERNENPNWVVKLLIIYN